MAPSLAVLTVMIGRLSEPESWKGGAGGRGAPGPSAELFNQQKRAGTAALPTVTPSQIRNMEGYLKGGEVPKSSPPESFEPLTLCGGHIKFRCAVLFFGGKRRL